MVSYLKTTLVVFLKNYIHFSDCCQQQFYSCMLYVALQVKVYFVNIL